MAAAETLPIGRLDEVALGGLAPDDFTFPAKNPSFPLVVRPRSDARFERLHDVLRGDRRRFRAELGRAGAILLRGFEVTSIEQFEALVTALGIEPSQEYPLGAAARRRIARFAWTTTELLDQLPLPPHAEMAYRRVRPRFLGLFCAEAPRRFGETPIFDSRAALADLPGDVRATLASGDVSWCHYYSRGGGMRGVAYDKAWPEVFGTEDRAEVERLCARFSARCEWHRGGRLGVVSDTPSILAHPESGEETLVFQTPHLETFLANIRLLRPRHGLARNAVLRLLVRLKATFGGYPFEARDRTGKPLPAALFRAVYDALWRNASVFRWHTGDVLILDNALAHHGRLNVVRPRTVYIVLGDMHAV